MFRVIGKLIRTLSLYVLVAAMGCLIGQIVIPWLWARAPEDDFDAARMLLEDLREDGDGLWFRRDTVDADRVYRALETRLPYAFTMHCRTLQDGSAELSIEIENQAAQEQAEGLARGIVQSLRLEGMDERARLLALHDWLVMNCAYDMRLAESSTLDGAQPPFTAAGALVDGTAVCMGYARAYQMLCDAAGIETYFIVSEKMNHAWNAVRLEGELLFIDCTYDDPVPDRPGLAGHEFFLVDAAALRETHTWDEDFYEKLLEKLYPERPAAQEEA